MDDFKKRIRILFTIPNFDTAGSGKALLNLALGLNPAFFEVHIACQHKNGDFFKIVEQSGLPIHVFKFTTPMKPYIRGVIECYKISRRFNIIEPDLIHSFHYAADYSEPLAAKFAGVKWLFTKKNMNWGGSSKNSWFLRSLLAHKIIVQNEDMLTLFYPKSKKVCLIARGVSTSQFQYAPLNSVVKKELNLNDNDRVVACIANLTPIKGIDILLKSFKIAQGQNKIWKLLVIGDYKNPYGKAMLELANTLNLGSSVIFCGKQLEVSSYINASELVVLPTLGKGEGSPVSLLEAMACEKNILATAVPGIRDQLKKYPEHLVAPGDVNSLADALKLLFSNTTDQNRVKGKVFRKHVITHYGIDREIEQTERLYVSVMSINY